MTALISAGFRELLQKEFLYRSPEDGTFFVNIRSMFNGDHLAFVKAYHLKDADKQPTPPPSLKMLQNLTAADAEQLMLECYDCMNLSFYNAVMSRMQNSMPAHIRHCVDV